LYRHIKQREHHNTTVTESVATRPHKLHPNLQPSHDPPKTERDSKSEDEDTARQTPPTPKCHVWDNDINYSTEERAEFKVIHNKWASREQAAAVEAAAAGQPQDVDWLDRYADNPYNEILAVHERAEARVAVDSDGEDSGVQPTS
jgi:hypothetical protein